MRNKNKYMNLECPPKQNKNKFKLLSYECVKMPLFQVLLKLTSCYLFF